MTLDILQRASLLVLARALPRPYAVSSSHAKDRFSSNTTEDISFPPSTSQKGKLLEMNKVKFICGE